MAIVTTQTALLTCDRDGVTATSVSPEPTLPPGWLALSSLDPAVPAVLLCPQCAGLFDGFMKRAPQS